MKTTEGSFWTTRQRQAHSLHEISYRACFKPQLPRFFIERYTRPGDCVLDPFMGRGTTPLEAALLDRIPFGGDINPLSVLLTRPRLNPPRLIDVKNLLDSLSLDWSGPIREDLLVFYHPDTLREITALRHWLAEQGSSSQPDPLVDWIRMVAANRLTGHSKGFFSVYTLPPNQAVSIASQQKINARLNQSPEYRDTKALILKKSRALLADLTESQRIILSRAAASARLWSSFSWELSHLPRKSVQLVVTSPPFLNEVDYHTDNWLRMWFCGISHDETPISIHGKISDWIAMMQRTLEAIRPLLTPTARVAIEVGEIRKGKVQLEEHLIEAGRAAGLHPRELLINRQQFTKTSNCWGVENQKKGTNTNRIVIFEPA